MLLTRVNKYGNHDEIFHLYWYFNNHNFKMQNFKYKFYNIQLFLETISPCVFQQMLIFIVFLISFMSFFISDFPLVFILWDISIFKFMRTI